MKALITVINRKEAEDVLKVGCDILDIKNPSEGSLGANYPWVIKAILEIVPKEIEVSLAIGDVPNLAGTVSMAVLGALQFSPQYIKVGLKGPKTKSEAIQLMGKAVKTIKMFGSNSKVVAAAYADYYRAGSINPFYLPEIAYKSRASVAMIDALIKNGENLLDIMSIRELTEFVSKCHEKGLKVALAGSLNETHIEKIAKTGADIFGIRGAICSQRNRKANLKKILVKKIVSKIRSIK